jgi:peptide/nickel transport system substrate-binding protein
VIACLALAASGCSDKASDAGKKDEGPGAGSHQATLGRMAPADAGPQGTPVKGGTLRLAGKGDVDHLDSASAYYAPTWSLMRAWTRQLVSYPNDKDLSPTGRANQVVADVATAVPRPTDGGRTYTFHIRQGVKWHAPSGDRQVTAQDFVLGFKRLCNPVQPAGALGYYADNIVGMQKFCDGFAKVAQTVPAIKAYMQSHDISGIQAPDASTLVFHLNTPVADFLNIMALPFSSAVPVEYLDYLPDSPQFRQHTISDGPYMITSYQAKQSIHLERNPAWDPSTDPLRKAYVDSIQVTEGVSEESVAQQMQAGSTDLYFSNQLPVSYVRKARAQHDPKLGYAPTGDVWYLVMNLLSPNQNGAMGKAQVRQALNYAVDKRHVIQQLGGPSIAAPVDTILTPTLLGFKDVHPYGTAPNIAKAKELLRQAGYPNGLTLKYLYPTDATREVQLFTLLQQDLAPAGIRRSSRPTRARKRRCWRRRTAWS